MLLRRTGVEKNKGITMNAATFDEIGSRENKGSWAHRPHLEALDF